MAQSNFATQQFASEQLVESCGAILFDLSDPQLNRVCLIRQPPNSEWLLAKGRRNIGESRKDTAIREAFEETGYRCRLLHVTMSSRAPAIDDAVDVPDKPRVYSNVTEPFMFTIRSLPEGEGVKIIWWYIATLDEQHRNDRGPGEAGIKAEFFACDEAIEKLHFESDREILRKAIRIVEDTLHRR